MSYRPLAGVNSVRSLSPPKLGVCPMCSAEVAYTCREGKIWLRCPKCWLESDRFAVGSDQFEMIVNEVAYRVGWLLKAREVPG
jgi:hypothetical protein